MNEFILNKIPVEQPYFVLGMLEEDIVCIPVNKNTCVPCIQKRTKSSVWVDSHAYKKVDELSTEKVVQNHFLLEKYFGCFVDITITDEAFCIKNAYAPLCLENCNDRQ